MDLRKPLLPIPSHRSISKPDAGSPMSAHLCREAAVQRLSLNTDFASQSIEQVVNGDASLKCTSQLSSHETSTPSSPSTSVALSIATPESREQLEHRGDQADFVHSSPQRSCSELRLDAFVTPLAVSTEKHVKALEFFPKEDRFLRQLSIDPRNPYHMEAIVNSSVAFPIPLSIRGLRQISAHAYESTDQSSPKASAMVTQEKEDVEALHDDGSEIQLTVPEAVYTMVNWCVCTTVLAIPHTFAEVGLSAGLLVVLVTGVCMYTALLMGDVLAHLNSLGVPQPTFLDAAMVSFGGSGAILVSVLSYLEFPAVVVQSFIVQGHTLNDMMPGLGFNNAVFISASLTAVMSVVSEKVYAYISALSVLTFLLICFGVVISGLELPQQAHDTRLTGDVTRLPSSTSIILFCGAIHPLLPQLRACAKSDKDYKKATCTAFSIWGVFVLAFGAVAFYIYGDALQPIVSRNVGRDLQMSPVPSLQGIATISSWLVLFKAQLSSKSYVTPFQNLMTQILGLGAVVEKSSLAAIALSVPFLSGSALVAIALENEIELVLAVSGMLFQNLNGIIFPTLMYLCLCKPSKVSQWVCSLSSIGLGVMLVIIQCSVEFM